MEYVTSTLMYMHTKKLQTTLCTHIQIQNQSFDSDNYWEITQHVRTTQLWMTKPQHDPTMYTTHQWLLQHINNSQHELITDDC